MNDPDHPDTAAGGASPDPFAMVPDHVADDVRAARSMSAALDRADYRDVKASRDLANRIAQCLGRLADWEDTDPDLAARFGDALARQEAHDGRR